VNRDDQGLKKFRAALVLEVVVTDAWRARGARAYTGDLGAKPPEAYEIFVFKTLIFNTSAGALHQIMCCLVCLFLCSCSQVYEFTVRICSLAIADQHLCIYPSGSVVQAKQITYVL